MLEDELAGKSSHELIELLYDRACRDLSTAAGFMGIPGNPTAQADAVHLVVHAQQIIAELNRSVNPESGALAVNLSRIYEYCQDRLTQAVKDRDPEPVREILSLISELHDAWKVLLDNTKKALSRQA